MMRLILPLCLLGQPVMAACNEGDSGSAYRLGHDLALHGVDTTARREVADDLATCFVIGYREGRLQRLLRAAQRSEPSLRRQRRPG